MFETMTGLLIPPEGKDEFQDAQVRLLHTSLIMVILFSVAIPIIFATLSENGLSARSWISSLLAGAISIIAYVLMKLRYFNTASIIFILSVHIAITSHISGTEAVLDDIFLPIYASVIILGSLLLNRAGVIGSTVLVLATMTILYILYPTTVAAASFAALILAFALIGVLLYTAPTILLHNISQLQIANDNLRHFAQQQEDRVRERTRDLTLAFDAANHITQIRNLGELLDTAVTQIQQRFNLYYVQIYLTDASEKTLTLQATTGSIGAELLRQGDRLDVGLSSVSSEAAYYRKTVTITDTTKNSRYRTNTLLTETKSEMAIPLIVNEKVLGVLDLHASKVNDLNESQIQVFQILANQLAGAIDNANLFTQVTQTQELLTAQTRLLSRRNWEDYLGNADDPDRLRAYFSKDGIENDSTAVTIHDALYTTPINVTGETVGFIQIENAPNYQWTDDDANLVKNVAQQVSQRIENLRLLYESERYRDEAEQALRRLTKETWDSYVEDAPVKEFAFHAGQVEAVETAQLNKPTFKQSLEVRGEAIGELAIRTEEPLDHEASQLVTAVTNQLSTHLESIRLTKQTEQRVAELAIINDITNAVQNLQNLDDLLEAVGNRITDAFKPSAAFIALYNKEENNITFPYYIAEESNEYQRIDLGVKPLGNSLTAQIITSKKMIFYNYSYEEMVQAGAGTAANDQQAPSSFIGVPITSGTEVLGVVSIQNDRTKKRAFTKNDLNLIETLTASIGVAIQNTQLFAQTQQALADAQRQSYELASINQVIETATSGREMLATAQQVAQEMKEIIQVEQVGVAMFLDRANELTVVGVADDDEHRRAMAKNTTIPVEGNPLTQQVIRTRKSVRILDVQQNPLTEPVRELMVTQGFESLAVIPMLAGDEVIGTVGLATVSEESVLSDEQIRLAETLVFQTATSFANIRLVDQLGALLQEAELQTQRLAKLNQMNAILSQANSINEVYEAVLNETADIFQAAHVSFIRLIENSDMGEVSHIRGIDNGMPAGYLININHEPIGEALRTGLLARITADPPLETILSTPVVTSGRIIGALNIGQTAHEKPFDSNDESLLLQIASLLNSIVENKQLLAITQQRAEKERLINDITRKIQNTVTVENALQVAIEELGRAFKATNTKVELGIQSTNGTNGHA